MSVSNFLVFFLFVTIIFVLFGVVLPPPRSPLSFILFCSIYTTTFSSSPPLAHTLKVVERVVFSVRVELVLQRAANVVEVLDLLLPFHERPRGDVLGLGSRHFLLFGLG